MINKGWECPKCGRVYAPYVDECRICGNDWKVTATQPTTFRSWGYCGICGKGYNLDDGHVCEGVPTRPIEITYQ